MHKVLAKLTAIVLPTLVIAQTAAPPGLGDEAARLAEQVTRSLDCRIQLIGAPRGATLSDAWYIAYSATGTDCDSAIEALRRDGAALELSFLRRPNRSQVRTLVRPMLRAGEMVSGCRLNLHGEPRIDSETGHWFVTYRSSGASCQDAAEELRHQGREYEIFFLERPAPGLIQDFR